MTFQKLIFRRGTLALCTAALMLSACGSQWKVRRADAEYQQAVAANNLIGQRIALLKLTNADEDVSDYWLRLAKVELELGSYGSAYGALSRAHELDRTDVPSLSMMTELAVLNGRSDLADSHLKELLVLAPNDRAVAVARGFGALREGNFEKAESNATILLDQSSNDSIGNILKTRILVTQRNFPDAVAFLEQKLLASGDDRALLRSLSAIYRFQGQWQKAQPLDQKSWKLGPNDPKAAAQAAYDALKAGNRPLALDITRKILADPKSSEHLENVLAVWVKLAPTDLSLAGSLPPNPSDPTRIAFAHYLNQISRPNQALTVLGRKSRPLGDRANRSFNAVFGEALAARGQAKPARDFLDRLLAQEADNPVALAARARLLSATGNHRGAITDGQRLVASYADNPDFRLLLTRLYLVSGDKRASERTLWDGYRDLPLAEALYNQVRQGLMTSNDTQGLLQLDRANAENRFSQLLKELA